MKVYVGILVGVTAAVVLIALVLLARPASPASVPTQASKHPICPGERATWKPEDLGDLYGRYISTRAVPNMPMQDRDILGAAFDVLNCVRNGTDQ